MSAVPDLSVIAKALGDPTRIRMLALLMEGRAATAKELAYGTGVTPATATAHLNRLLRCGLLEVRAQGRHRYFRLTSPEVARCVESLMVVAHPATPVSRVPHELKRARFCYDHLAGQLGTAVATAMRRQRWVKETDDAFLLTPRGERELTALGVDLASMRAQRRKLAPRCLDWSERRDHIGGALGAALAEVFLAQRWIRRRAGSREVEITARGEQLLAQHFGIRLEGEGSS